MLSPSEVGWDLALYAQEWLEERFRLTLKLAEDVAKKPTPRAVHDLRVACRRLREAIGFFRGVAEVPPLSDVDGEARRMARGVRRLREIDVAVKRLDAFRGDSSALDAQRELVGELRSKRRRLAKKKRKRIVRRARRLESIIQLHLPMRVRPRAADVDPAKETELRAFVDARVSSRHAEVDRLFALVPAKRGGTLSDSDTDHLHAVRVAIKHWRYASEIARAVMPRVLYRPMVIKLRHLQELGGKSQDFTDLAEVLKVDLTKRGGSGQRRILSAVQSAKNRAAREFYEALKALVPSAGPSA